MSTDDQQPGGDGYDLQTEWPTWAERKDHDVHEEPNTVARS